MTPSEISAFFRVYPEAVILKVGTRFFLSKDRKLAEAESKVKDTPIEEVTAKSKNVKEDATK